VRRTAIPVLAVAVSIVLATGLAVAGSYPIKLTRPLHQGDRYWMWAKGSRVDSSVMTREDEVVRKDELTVRVELQAIVEILQVDESGRPLKEELNIQYLVYGLGGELTDAMNTGEVVVAETVGTRTEFRLGDKRLPPLAEAALEIVVSTYRGDVPDEDLIFGSTVARSIGESWKVNGEAFAYHMRSTGAGVDQDDLDGSVSLAGVETIQGFKCLRLKAAIQVDGFSMDDLPPGVEIEDGKAEIEFSGLFPLDSSLPKIQDATTVRTEMVLRNNEGAMAGAVLKTSSSRSGEKTMIPFSP
jgi:hypothetical protein